MIHVDFETQVWVVIGGEKFKELGDPYDYVVLAKLIDGGLYFFRLAGKFRLADKADIENHFKKLGYKEASWIRRKKGKVKFVKISEDL